MKVPIRMIGIVTVILWIFLIFFTASAAYSVTYLHFEFKDPQIETTLNKRVILTLPIDILNKGYYNIGSFNVTTRVSDAEGSIISQGSTLVRVIRKGESVTILHNVTLNIDDLLRKDQSYLFNDTLLGVAESIGLRIAEIIPVEASANLSIPWGAPIYNLTVEQPLYMVLNLTHLQVTIPISFENHSFFNISGQLQLKMLNEAKLTIGSNETTIEVAQHSHYKEHIQFDVLTSSMISKGYFEIYVSTPLFNYGPQVTTYG